MEDERVTEILLDFEPYRVTMPVQKRFIGRADIVFPDHHLKLVDLSLHGAHIGGDARVFALHVDLGESGMDAGDMIAFLANSQRQMESLHRAVQMDLDKTFLGE